MPQPKLAIVADQPIKIEKGVPMPVRHGGHGNSKYPFATMEVGDSFYIPWGDRDRLKIRSVLSNAISAFQLRNEPKKFSSRKDESGIRVWRTA